MVNCKVITSQGTPCKLKADSCPHHEKKSIMESETPKKSAGIKKGNKVLKPEKEILKLKNPYPKTSLSYFAFRVAMKEYENAKSFIKKWNSQGLLLIMAESRFA